MEFKTFNPRDALAVENLFYTVFSHSEGEQEGNLVGQLARELMSTTDKQDLYGYVAVENGHLLGAIFFSRLTFESGIEAFVLSPVAVHSDYQRTGIGQGLINHGLQQLRNAGVDLVITYGDPDYYIKVGFKPLSQKVIQPPHELSQPRGWIGQSLKGSLADSTAQGVCRCVHALNDKSYW